MSEIRGIGAELSIRATAQRTTPPPASRQFRDAVESGAVALMQRVEGVGAFLPAGSMIAAAVRGAPNALAEGAESAGEPASGPLLEAGGESMRYLELQRAISDENLRFTTLSNVLKARHETAKTAVNNIR